MIATKPMKRSISIGETLLVLLLAAVPLLAGRYLPLIDAPQHMAMARILVGLVRGDPGFAEIYELDPWPVPYWLYYIMTGGLSLVVSIETANKLVLYIYTVGLAFGVREVLLAFGRNPRWWVLSVPLAWTNCFIYAFMAYLVGIPIVLFGIAATERAFRGDPGETSARWWLGVLAFLAYLAHAQAFLWLMLSVAVLLMLHWRGVRWGFRALLPVAPTALLFFAWVARAFRGAGPSSDNSTYGTLGNLGMVWEPHVARWTTAPEDLFGGATDGSNRWIGIAWIAMVVAGAWIAGREWRPGTAWGSLRHRPSGRVVVLLAAFLAAWAILPYSVRGQWYLAPRYLVFVAGMAIVAAAGWTPRHDFIRRAGIALVALYALNTARLVRDFQPAMQGLEPLLDRIPAGQRLAHFPFDERNTLDAQGKPIGGTSIVVDMPTSVSAFGFLPEVAGSPYGWMSPTHHASAYYLVRKWGLIGVSFAASPTNPGGYRSAHKPTALVEDEYEKVDLAAASRDFGWFLVRGPLQGTTQRLPEFARLEATEGTWQLWRSRSWVSERRVQNSGFPE